MKISVIIPCYNAEKYIKKCINSICKQTFKDFEIVIVNDCSTDSSLTIIQEFEKKDNRIKIINHSINKGAHNARQSGINAANGEYIAFIDSDDYIDKNYLKKLFEGTDNENIDLVILSAHQQKFRLFSVKKVDIPLYNHSLIGKKIDLPFKTNLNTGFFGVSQLPCYSAMKLYRKSLLLNQPPIDLFHNDDVIMLMNIFHKIKSLKFINYDGYYYRMGGGSSSINNYLVDFKKLYNYKKNKISCFEFHDTFDPMKFILVELKNCFYEYYMRQFLNGRNQEYVIKDICNEIRDSLYSEFNYLKKDHFETFNTPEIQAILLKDSLKILKIIKSKLSYKRKIKHFISKIL